MRKLNLMTVSERGDSDFGSLDDVDKDLYVLLLFFQLRDMEGITHFYSHHACHIPRLVAFLTAAEAPNARAVAELSAFLHERAGGSWDVESLDEYLCDVSEEDESRIDEWDQEYSSRTEEMWDCVREYTRKQYDTDFG